MTQQKPTKIRARGITVGRLPIGKKNCLTDVEGVKVGHVTLDYPLHEVVENMLVQA